MPRRGRNGHPVLPRSYTSTQIHLHTSILLRLMSRALHNQGLGSNVHQLVAAGDDEQLLLLIEKERRASEKEKKEGTCMHGNASFPRHHINTHTYTHTHFIPYQRQKAVDAGFSNRGQGSHCNEVHGPSYVEVAVCVYIYVYVSEWMKSGATHTHI